MGMFSKLFGADDEGAQQIPNLPEEAVEEPRFQPAIPTGELAPLTLERVTQHFDEEGYNYGIIDADPAEGSRAKIESGWDGIPFLFNFNGQEGEILTVFAQSSVDIPLDAEDQLDAFIENWHREHYFPKVYTRRASADTALRVCCEHSIDLEHGVTDKQLALQLHCAIATSLDAIRTGYAELGISLEEEEA
ncbi:hypothetical protein HMPREF0044_0757 [Gleimia coleocanis DSM 15436]|uniref:Bacterial sensory transduction regulator n=1 Tax=Gleimia coleocanis DSM 15436 TaxID=525245 RepID=C0W114_9ACTO|nr:YbjN domain-containing protein [Gleimia coleocanis]EEH63738.1 hypothetical protein HMPREF0044_0757 [Gleimia coleocanis DSM 15436]